MKIFFNPSHIVSVEICPNGVKKEPSNAIISKQVSTILETTSWTYIIKGELQFDLNNIVDVDSKIIISKTRCDKLSYYQAIGNSKAELYFKD